MCETSDVFIWITWDAYVAEVALLAIHGAIFHWLMSVVRDMLVVCRGLHCARHSMDGLIVTSVSALR